MKIRQIKRRKKGKLENYSTEVNVIENLIAIMEKMPDPRQAWKIKHKLSDILLICLLAVTSNANSASEIYDFAVSRKQWLQTILCLEHGIPSRLTFARVLQIIQPKAFAVLFSQIMSNVEVMSKRRVVALDGKALAGTYHKEGRKGVIHLVGAWCSENKISLAQVNTQTKGNEITAIPELLDLLCIQCPKLLECAGKNVKKKVLGVSEHNAQYYEHSQMTKTTQFKLKYKKRASHEWKNREMKRFHGLDRARGYGLKSMSMQAKLTALAVNLKRIAVLLSFCDHVFWKQIANFTAYHRLVPLFMQIS